MNNSNLSRITFLPLLVVAVAFVCVVPDRAIAQSEEVEEILVTSTRSRRSFEASPIRVEVLGSEELNEKAPASIIITLVGNKIDLEDSREVSQEVAEEYAQKVGLVYREVSAKEDINVASLFTELAK